MALGDSIAKNLAKLKKKNADRRAAEARKQGLTPEEYDEKIKKAQTAKLQAISASFQGSKPSAVVQQNNKEVDWEQEYRGSLSRQQRLLYDQSSTDATIAEGPEVAAALLETREKARSQLADARKRFITDVQSFLYSHIDTLTAYYAERDKRDNIAKKRSQIHRLANENMQKGTYINLLSNRGPLNKDGHAMYSEFVHATPDQLAHLVPLLRFFMVDQDGNEEEIYFSDYTTGAFAKKIADLRSSGDINEFLAARGAQQGSDAGISSFTWNYHNKHEGDYIIEANLELYFGTLAELANINYLRFLFPTGTATAMADDLNKAASSVAGGERKRGRINRKDKRIIELSERIEKIGGILARGEADNVKVPNIQDAKLKASRSKSFRQLKVIVGWSVPDGSEKELRKSFRDPVVYQSFLTSLEATNKAIFLNLYDYNVEFQQEGPTKLSLSYLGSTDNYLATAASDVFGSNKLSDAENKFLYTVTDISIEGFSAYEGNVIDVRKTTSSELSKLDGPVTSVGAGATSGPYLQSVIKRQKEGAMQHLMRNSDGQLTIGVTLAGLKAAQELTSLELQLAELQKKGEESTEVENLRLRGQVLTLMYDRAEVIRLRDIYSRYLENLLGTEYIQKAIIQTSTTVGAGPPEAPKLIFDNRDLTDKDKKEAIKKTIATASGEEGSNLPPYNNTEVYYMRLGDILHRAIQTSGLREDINLILGNTGRLNVPHSLYDIPITLDNFGQFFYNRIVSRKLRSYPFRYFLNDMLKIVARIVNQDPRVYDRIAFDYTVVSGVEVGLKDLPFRLDGNHLAQIAQSQENPLASAGLKFKHFYPIFENSTSHKNRTGDKFTDEAEGIYHYVIGSDRGLAKSFNFSRQDTEYFQEMLIESNNLDDKIQALFLPQDVNITMYGNTLHKNGDLIYVDSRPSLGSFAGPVLGIGGYYRVIRSTHQISNRGYETNLECVFELRVDPDKSRG